jgi:2-polyprenyl-3-methyl-5-hydroxy-6-metoxy-1,4-benzoquinol methylase
MKPSRSPEGQRVAKYFDRHAVDFDTIYAEDKAAVRKLRDRARGIVVRRLEFVNQVAEQRKPSNVLDVGCGSGRFAISLAARGAKVVGLDFAGDMLALARQLAAEAGVGDRCTFEQADFLEWKSDETFDLALAIGVVDYVSEPEPLIAKMAAISGGSVIVSFPRLLHPLVPLRMMRLRASGCPVYFYRKADVERMGRAHLPRFEIVDFGRDYLLVGNP